MVCSVRDLFYKFTCIYEVPNLKLFLFETAGQDMDGVFLILLALYRVRRNGLYNSCLTFTNDLGSLSYSFYFKIFICINLHSDRKILNLSMINILLIIL